MTMYGGVGGGPRVSMGYGEQHNENESITNQNSYLKGKNVSLDVANNADFINKAVNEADKIEYRRLAQDEVNFISDNIEKIKEELSNKYGSHTMNGKTLQLNAEQVALQAAKYMVDGDFAKSRTGSDIVTNEATLKEVGAILLKMSDGKYIRNNYVDGTTEKMFTATKEDYNNPDADPDNEKGLGNQGVVIVPTTRVVQVVGSGVKSVSPVILKKTEQVYDSATLGVVKRINKIAPNTTNNFLKNNVKVNENVVDVISDYNLLGIPSPSKIGYGIGGYGLLDDYLNKNNKDKE